MLQLTEARRQAPTVLRIGFWLTEAFDFYSLANALEPLRLANETAGQAVCQWQILSLHGHPLKASNGISTATAPLQRAQPLDVLILCAADDLQASGECAEVSRHLQHWAAQPVGLGALGKAGWLLARLGELDNLKCSLPEPDPSWALASFARLKPVPAPFCIDAGRLTCVGAQAVQGLMHQLLAQTHGRSLLLRMTRHTRRRTRPMQSVHTAPEKLQQTLTLMNQHLARTLGIDELAECMGVSRRHLERLFKSKLGCTPSRHYLDLRLQQARQLLQAGKGSMVDIAQACGFVSVPHFFRCYRQYFGAHPREELAPAQPLL